MSLFLRIEVPDVWIAAARRGEREAQRRLYEALARPVHTLLRRLVGRPAVAEELLHEVFIELLRGLEGYRGSGSFAGWVRAIAVRRALMYLRSPAQSAPTAWLDPASGGAVAGVGAEAATAPGAAEADDRQDELERALNALPPAARSVVWLHDVEGYTHAEIGRLHGQSASYSKSQLARAHAQLRGLLEPANGGVPCTLVSTN